MKINREGGVIINPKWFEELRDKYLMGINNYFIITGNISDYVLPGKKIYQFLNEEIEKMGFEVSLISPMHSLTYERDTYFPELEDLNYLKNNSYNISIMAEKLRENKKRAMILKHPEMCIPIKDDYKSVDEKIESVVLKETLEHSSFMHSSNILIILTESLELIDSRLRGPSLKSHHIEIPYPQESQRLEFIEFLDKTSVRTIKKELSNDIFAKMTTGLTLMGIEDVYLMSEAQGILKKSIVKQRKNELIKAEYGDVIEILDADDYNFKMYAGQDHLKSYHREVVVNPMLRGDTELVPKGLLYTGPPGTGKTHFAKCLAGEAGINFVEFKISKILDMWVGSSERNFAKALNCFKSITPVGVFIDEIDQTFSRDSDNTGVRQAIFGMLLSVLSEEEYRGKIIWIAATNYPNKLDEALKRTGRFDKKMPFLPPEKSDRIETFRIHINRFNFSNSITEDDLSTLGNLTSGYTQAEIEGIVLKGIEIMRRKMEKVLGMEDMLTGMKYSAKASNNKIDEMIDIAIQECNDLEFLDEKHWTKKDFAVNPDVEKFLNQSKKPR